MKSIKFLENNGVEVKESLELFGNIETYNETIGDFLVGIHTKIKQLISCMNNRDLANYTTYAHSMKNDAKYFGFTKLAELAYEHEKKGNAGDIYFITEHINDFITETNNVIKLIQEYMNGTDDYDISSDTEVDNADVFDGKTILVVDDSNIIRNFVKRIFSEEYNVGTAKDGEEAIRIIKANMNNDCVETILLDLNMPKVDGFAVLEFMKGNNLFQKMPVSIISGDSSKETIDKAFNYDIVDMLSKPFSDQNVKMVIEKTLIYKDEAKKTNNL